MHELADTILAPGLATAGVWHPRFPDQTLVEWLIVVCYFATAMLCLRARRVTRIGAEKAKAFDAPCRRSWNRMDAYRACSMFWSILFVLFIFLAFNKHLDLHWEFTKLLRSMSRAQGWYAQRRIVQGALLVLLVVGGSGVLGVILWQSRRLMPRLAPAFVGTVMLALFLMSKMSSFHYIDRAFEFRIMGVEVYQPLELAGILSVALCALANCWWHDIRRVTDLLRPKTAATPG